MRMQRVDGSNDVELAVDLAHAASAYALVSSDGLARGRGGALPLTSQSDVLVHLTETA